jgi:hypothetical protein
LLHTACPLALGQTNYRQTATHSTYPDKPVMPSLMLPPTFLQNTTQKALLQPTNIQITVITKKAFIQPVQTEANKQVNELT